MPDHAERDIADRFLRRVAEVADDDRLREMARGILDGHATIEDSLASSAYATALHSRLSDFVDWYGSLSDEEQAAQVARCAAAVDDLREASGDTTTGVAPPAGSSPQ